MKETKLNKKEIQLLKNNLQIYKNRLIMYLVFTGIFLLFLVAIDLIGIFQGTSLFGRNKIYLLIPLIITVLLILFYLFRTRFLRKDINKKFKISEMLEVTNKHNERYGTFTTSNYLAAGSSVIYIVKFGDLTYVVSEDEYDKIKLGDILTVHYCKRSNIILGISPPP